MPNAASGLSSRNGLPGSSSRSTRSRTSSFPRSRCFCRALSEPPRRTTSVRSRSSATRSGRALTGQRLTVVNHRRYPAPVERTLDRPHDRRSQILDVAAKLFAERGFHGVSVGDIGKAVGVSGPALYKHFDSKDAVLAEMLVSISERLLAEGLERVARADGPE